jgi:hypothetical protein
MLPSQRNPWRRLPLALAGAVLAAGLAGCGADNDHQAPPPPPPPPVASGDQFLAYVQQAVATSPDTDEPASIDGVTATMPDTAEAEPVN